MLKVGSKPRWPFCNSFQLCVLFLLQNIAPWFEQFLLFLLAPAPTPPPWVPNLLSTLSCLSPLVSLSYPVDPPSPHYYRVTTPLTVYLKLLGACSCMRTFIILSLHGFPEESTSTLQVLCLRKYSLTSSASPVNKINII